MKNVPDAGFLDHALEIALAAARAAGERIAQHFRQGVAVEIKPDATPVTVADREAEDIIRAALKQAFPEHAILGEERGREGEGAFLWLVDPLDGTKSFVRGAAAARGSTANACACLRRRTWVMRRCRSATSSRWRRMRRPGRRSAAWSTR